MTIITIINGVNMSALCPVPSFATEQGILCAMSEDLSSSICQNEMDQSVTEVWRGYNPHSSAFKIGERVVRPFIDHAVCPVVNMVGRYAVHPLIDHVVCPIIDIFKRIFWPSCSSKSENTLEQEKKLVEISCQVPKKLSLDSCNCMIRSHIERACDLPKYCTEMATLLERQPLFTGYGNHVETSKVIHLESWDDARICEIFNENAKKILGESQWRISAFGIGNYQFTDSNHHLIKHGLTLSLYDGPGPCSLSDLEASYEEVFRNMTTGWVSARPEEHPDIMFKENPDEFQLFIKKKTLIEEDDLIAFIARRVGIEQDIKCHGESLGHSVGYGYTDERYLWIRRSALMKVIDTFGFRL